LIFNEIGANLISVDEFRSTKVAYVPQGARLAAKEGRYEDAKELAIVALQLDTANGRQANMERRRHTNSSDETLF
jgi:hypothetical protein